MRAELPSGTPTELARPRTGATPPLGLALAPDIMGLRPLFDDLCARLAEEQGWVVCAPEPFPGRESLGVEDRMAAMGTLVDDRQVGDLAQAGEMTGCTRRAVLGFCMGGMYALKAAATGAFDRAVSFYGMIRVPEDWRGPAQADPLDLLAAWGGRTQVLAIVGGSDPYTPPAQVDELRTVPGVTVVEYPEAEHGFVHDPSRPSHRPDDASDAWSRAIAFICS